jgi:integral membrane sensor domain MASE1
MIRMKIKFKTIEIETNKRDHARFTGLLLGITLTCTITLLLTNTLMFGFPFLFFPGFAALGSWYLEGDTDDV